MKCFKLFCALHTKPNPWVFVIEEQLLFTCILYCIHPVTLLWPWVLEHFMMGMCGNSGYLRCVCVCVCLYFWVYVCIGHLRGVCVFILWVYVCILVGMLRMSRTPRRCWVNLAVTEKELCASCQLLLLTAVTEHLCESEHSLIIVWIWTLLNYCACSINQLIKLQFASFVTTA